MVDIGFIVGFSISVAIVVGPIVAIVLLLANAGAPALSNLFTLPSGSIAEPLPPEEDTPPRWRPELLRAHGTAGRRSDQG